MWKYKHSEHTFRQIFEDAVENKRKGVRIVYIWLNTCGKCGAVMPQKDDEYTFDYRTEGEAVTMQELVEALKDFTEGYSIYEDCYEEDLKVAEYIALDEICNVEVYYHYVTDETNNIEWCDICQETF